MAAVSPSMMMNPQSRMSTSYFPAIPPKAPDAALSYSRAVLEAPYTALMGVVVDARNPDRHPVTPRCRMRSIVGHTNRWRLPESLGSDLLGSAQAVKAISMPYNQSLMNIITAESPSLSINLDTAKPYRFRYGEDRPYTDPDAVPRFRRAKTSVDMLSSLHMPTTAPTKSSSPLPVGPVRSFVPRNARPATPKDIFLYHSKKSKSFLGPDVLLRCLNMDWELHRPFLQKASVLSKLLKEAEDPRPQKYYKNPASETLDNYIKKNKFYSTDYQDISDRLSFVEKTGREEEEEVKAVDHPAHISPPRVSDVTTIKLDIKDPLVTKTAMAVALGNLYHDDLDIEVEEVAGVLAAASVIGCKNLMEGCGKIMLQNITYRTVCRYHQSASKYEQEHVVLACERWLELNLIPQLSIQIQLREMSMDLLQKILKSNRLFVYSEYSVYKALAYWLFLQLNPHLQLMPSHSSVLSFFNSLPKSISYTETDEGQIYKLLFAAVRLHGIADTTHIQDMQIMNILPQSQLIDLLSQHYHALQGGGDMCALKSFSSGGVRQGFVVDDEPHYHSEVLSLHGFHFELKAVRSRNGNYTFFMQRLKPGDPILSFRQCERHTFSMRADREVRYSINVQYLENGENHYFTTGILCQKFGLGEKTSRSEVVKLKDLKKPIYVTFAVLFPSS